MGKWLREAEYPFELEELEGGVYPEGGCSSLGVSSPYSIDTLVVDGCFGGTLTNSSTYALSSAIIILWG